MGEGKEGHCIPSTLQGVHFPKRRDNLAEAEVVGRDMKAFVCLTPKDSEV